MNTSMEDAKIKRLMKIIDEIAESTDTDKIKELEAEVRDISGRTDIYADAFFEYWSWTSLEDLARSILMPEPVYKGLDDEQLAEIISKICECQYSESEMDYQLKVLKLETGIADVSDYIFYPDNVGLNMNADTTEIIAKILADRTIH